METENRYRQKARFLFISLILSLMLFGVVPLRAQETVYPRYGEGITLLLKRFDRSGAAYEREFIRLNKGKLGKNNSLRRGIRYTLPPKKLSTATAQREPEVSGQGRKNHQPLFGKKLASYTVNSSELRGACFYLVSGHGGPDPGAIGRMNGHTLHEDEYAYDIMLRLARNLLSRGAKVHIIIQDARDGIRNQLYLNNSKRETCMGSPIPLNQVKRLEQRCVMINALNRKDKERYKRAIFIHVDSRSKHKRTDVFFYHQPKSQAGKRLAKTMKSTFAHKYDKHQPGRGFSGTVDDRDLYVLRNAAPPSLFVELGNIQNRYDQQRIILANNRQALANWLCEGFIADYKRSKR